MSNAEIAWAAGLIEGEGCFTLVRNSKARGGRSAKFVVQMNDLDIIQRLQSILGGVGKIYSRPPRGSSKASYSYQVYRAAHVKEIIELVWPWLGERRQGKAQELLNWINRD